MKFKQYLLEKVDQKQLNDVEKYADKLFSKIEVDVNFTKHFMDRVNDTRNGKDISSAELIKLFRLSFKKHKSSFKEMNPDAEAVIKDMVTDVNMPFVMKWDYRNNEMDLIAKTIMRKKEFKTNDPELKI